MSDSVRSHRWQPTRLPHLWDFPGKNTGVGGHFLLQCMKVKSESEVAQSCLTLSDPMDCSLPGSSVHGIFQARKVGCLEPTRVGCQCRRPQFDSWVRKIPWIRDRLYPLQYSCLENSMDCIVHGVTKSRTQLSDFNFTFHFHFSLSCTGEGNGNPLQCSCLENPRDGGASWAAVYGVAQSRTRLK